MASPQVQIFEDVQQVAHVAAQRFVAEAAAAIRTGGRFSVALAGGATPQRTYELLAGQPLRSQVDWANVHVFFGDERCVPPTDPQSNFRMASLAMLDRVSLPPRNVHRMIGEADPNAAAMVYEAELRAFFPARSWPAFDLLLLGMGDDGHTASLFPGSAAVTESKNWVVANWAQKFKTFRITLSPPALNAARHVLFVVTGAAKAQRVHEVLRGPRDPQRLPAQLISPANGFLEWLLDKAAAAEL